MAMDTTSRFRFRDHQDAEASAVSDTSSSMSSVSSDPAGVDDDEEDDSDLQSMTAKGIKHLCSELLELKATSDEDFHRTIFANYLTFIRVLDEVEDMENELIKLKNQVFNQRKLVNELADGIYTKLLTDETSEPFNEEHASDESNPPTKLEKHIDDVAETLNVLLIENRVDEALNALEMEDVCIKRLHLSENYSVNVLELYDAAISEAKSILLLRLTLEAQNPRTAASELQKSLVGIRRLGDSHLATQLLLKNYHARIAARLDHFQDLTAFSNAVPIRELSRSVFSLISQAAKSFHLLHGERSPLVEQIVEWANEETEGFAACFNSFIRSISEISGGLSTVVQSVQFAISFCSLLKTQQLDMLPSLMERMHPCVMEVLDTHIDHFKKVLGIFTASDSWILGKYPVSGILGERCIAVDVGKEPECCLLTNSGRKLVTLLQAIAEDISPLIAFQMENSVIKCLADIFMEYILMLQKVIAAETVSLGNEKNVFGVTSQALMQQIPVLANLSTLVGLFSRIIRSSLHGMGQLNYAITGIDHSLLDSCFLSIQHASAQVRTCFCRQFVCRVLSTQCDEAVLPETDTSDQHDYSITSHCVMPSVPLQVLFLELRKIEKLAVDVDAGWLTELLRDLIEATCVWISDNKAILSIDERNTSVGHPNTSEQFILDIHFLVEIAKHGGYIDKQPNLLVTLMNSAFVLAQFDPERNMHNKWAVNAAAEAIERLLEIEKEMHMLELEGANGATTTDSQDLSSGYDYECETAQDDSINSLGSGEFVESDSEESGEP